MSKEHEREVYKLTPIGDASEHDAPLQLGPIEPEELPPWMAERVCKWCKTETRWELTRSLCCNGDVQVRWYCHSCQQFNKDASGNMNVAHSVLEQAGINIDGLRIVGDYKRQRCTKCGGRDAEEHHWLPKAFVGWEEADRWPKDWLCKKCHMEWHAIVTPGLVNGGKVND